MKARIYLRLAKVKGRIKVVANTKPNFESLYTQGYSIKKAHPTVIVAIDLDVPDEEFNASRICLEAKINKTVPAVELTQVDIGENP